MLSCQHEKTSRPETREPPTKTPGPPPDSEEGLDERRPEPPDRSEVRDPPPTTGPVG